MFSRTTSDLDGVIHDHTYAERDTAERHHVQRNAQHVHNQERKQDTARHCDGNSHGRAEVAQEKEQHDRGEQHAHPDVLNSVINRHVDIVGLIHNDIPLQGIVALKQGVKLSLCQLGDLHGVRAGLLVDRQDDTLLAVNLGDGVLILRLHGNIRNLARTVPPAGSEIRAFLTSSMDEYSPSVRTASVCEPLSRSPPGMAMLSAPSC